MTFYHSSALIHARKVDLGNKLDGRGCVWVGMATMDVEAVDTIFMHALWQEMSPVAMLQAVLDHHTCGGPSMVPFQLDICISSASSNP